MSAGHIGQAISDSVRIVAPIQCVASCRMKLGRLHHGSTWAALPTAGAGVQVGAGRRAPHRQIEGGTPPSRAVPPMLTVARDSLSNSLPYAGPNNSLNPVGSGGLVWICGAKLRCEGDGRGTGQ